MAVKGTGAVRGAVETGSARQDRRKTTCFGQKTLPQAILMAKRPLATTKRRLATAERRLPMIGRRLPTIGRPLPTIGRPLPTIGRPLPTIGRRLPMIGRRLPTVGRRLPMAERGRWIVARGRWSVERRRAGGERGKATNFSVCLFPIPASCPFRPASGRDGTGGPPVLPIPTSEIGINSHSPRRGKPFCAAPAGRPRWKGGAKNQKNLLSNRADSPNYPGKRTVGCAGKLFLSAQKTHKT